MWARSFDLAFLISPPFLRGNRCGIVMKNDLIPRLIVTLQT
jgi:hypothetical protein